MAATFSYKGNTTGTEYVFSSRPQYGRGIRVEVDPATNKPRRELVTYTIQEAFAEENYAENQQRYWALATALMDREGTLKGFDEAGNELFSESVRLETSNLPAAWNQYFTEVTVSFLVLRNLGGDDSLFAVYGGVIFNGVVTLRESASVQATAVERSLAFTGRLFADPQKDYATRRAELEERKKAMDAARKVMHGALTFRELSESTAYLKTVEAVVDDTAEALNWQLTATVTTPKPELARSARLGNVTLPGVRSTNESIQASLTEITGSISVSGSTRRENLDEAHAMEDAILALRTQRVADYRYGQESHKVQVDTITAAANPETFEVTWSASLSFREAKETLPRVAQYAGIAMAGVASFRSSSKLENGEWTGSVSASGSVQSYQVDIDDARVELDAAAAKLSTINGKPVGAFRFMGFSETEVETGGVDLSFGDRALQWSFSGTWKRVDEVRAATFCGVVLPGVTALKRGMRSAKGRITETVNATGKVDTLTRNLPEMEAIQTRILALRQTSGILECLGAKLESLVLESLECEIQNDVLTWSLAGTSEEEEGIPTAKYAGISLAGVTSWVEGGVGTTGTVAAQGRITGSRDAMESMHHEILKAKQRVSGALSYTGFMRVVSLDQLESEWPGGTELTWTLKVTFRDAIAASIAKFGGVQFPNVTAYKDSLRAAKTDGMQDTGTVTLTGKVYSNAVTAAERVADFQKKAEVLKSVRNGSTIAALKYGGAVIAAAKLESVDCDQPNGDTDAIGWTLVVSYTRDAREALAVVVGDLRLGGVSTWQSGVKSDGRGRYDGTISGSGKIVPPSDCVKRGEWLRLEHAKIKSAPCGPALAVAYQGFSEVCNVSIIDATLNEDGGDITWTFHGTYKIRDASTIQYDHTERLEGGERVISITGTARGDSAKTDVESLVKSLVGERAWKVSGSFTEKHLQEGKFDGTYATDDPQEYTFSYEYRQAFAVEWTLTVSTKRERDGTLVRSYSGTVKAETETDARAEAELLSKEENSRMLSSSFAVASSSTKKEYECQFSVEYEAAAELYAEISSEVAQVRFGDCSQTISGFVVAEKEATAVEFAHGIRERVAISKLKEQRESVKSNSDKNTKQARVDFNYAFFAERTQFKAAVKYTKRTSTDYRTGEVGVTYSGQVWANTSEDAGKAIAPFRVVGSSARLTVEETSENYADDIFESLSFMIGQSVQGTGIFEAELSVRTIPSRNHSIITLIPYGTPYVQKDCGITIGTRTVSGSVSASAKDTALTWARTHRDLVKDGDDVESPEETISEKHVLFGADLRALLFTVSFNYTARYKNLADK